MFDPHWSPAVTCCYAGDSDATPEVAGETSPEAPTVEVPLPAESPPTPPVEDLLKRVAELEAAQAGVAEREAAWTTRESELSSAIAERDGQLSEFRAKAERAAIVEALSAAASAADAFTPGQLVALLDRYATVGEAGVTLMIDGVAMSPSEAVGKMKEQPAYWNLFKSNAVPGIGGHSGNGMGAPGSGGQVNLATLTSAEYRRLRRESPHLLGLDRKPEGGGR